VDTKSVEVRAGQRLDASENFGFHFHFSNQGKPNLSFGEAEDILHWVAQIPSPLPTSSLGRFWHKGRVDSLQGLKGLSEI